MHELTGECEFNTVDHDEQTKETLGEASITPREMAIAGGFGSWRLTFRVGASGVRCGGGIKVGTDSDTDWGLPQFHDPTGPNYMTVSTSGKGRLSIVLGPGLYSHWLRVTVLEYPLEEGDEITLVYGDRDLGGPGSTAQTFAEEKRYFRVYVDSRGDGRFIEIVDPPSLRVIGGSAERLSIIAPSEISVGKDYRLVVRALDRFGNPSYAYDGTIRFDLSKTGVLLPREYVFRPDDHGVREFTVQALESGLYRICVDDEKNGLEATSNPVLCQAEPHRFSLFWGDIHGQVGRAEKIPEYFRFGRDVSALDYASHQRNDHEVSVGDWEETKRAVKEYDKQGRYVVFLGYEWSGEHSVGGDHNVYVLADNQPIRRSGHELVEDKTDVETDLSHITDLYREFKGSNVIIVPHVGGRPANLVFHDSELEPLIEVHSTHGTFEWFLREALERGYKVGFIAGSDDYKLRLGGAYPGMGDRRFVRGGLTAVYADELRRENIFKALKARRCYATTGDRIILRTSADDHVMGEEYVSEAPPIITVQVIGTDVIEKVKLFRNLEVVYELPNTASTRSSSRTKITWGGASRRWSYSGVLWDGELRVLNGKMTMPEFMPLDRGDERYDEVSETGFKWSTFTCGDTDGASFTVDGEDAEIVVVCSSIPVTMFVAGGGNRLCMPIDQADRASFHLRVKEIGSTPTVVDIGPIDRRITVYRIAESETPRECIFRFVDDGFRPGINAYWVSVVQSNGEMAWSSPIYVVRS
jgi:hypothetical protein